MSSKRSPSAANTFRESEVRAVVQLFDALYDGRDTKVLLRSRDVANVYAKFKRMKKKLEEGST